MVIFVTMEEKNQLVIDYINSIKNEFEKNGSPLSDETVRRGINRYIDSNKSFEEIKQEIDEMVEERLEQIRKRLEFLANMEKDVTRITDLDVDNLGITLNEQDIDLMMIANATTPSELQTALEKITNINIEISDIEMDEEQFQQLRQHVFDSYMASLTSRNKYLQNVGARKVILGVASSWSPRKGMNDFIRLFEMRVFMINLKGAFYA